MHHTYSDLPFLFILYIVTENNEIIYYVDDGGTIILPRYEFDAVYGNEAITTALARQMESDIGYQGMNGKISLADAKRHYEHEPDEQPFVALYDDDEDEDENEENLNTLIYGIDLKKASTEQAMKNDSPFRVCVAYDCVPCEKTLEDHETSPYVRWARKLFVYQPFPEWDAERKARMAQEKKIMRMPVAQWNAMISYGEITDRISVIATKIAETWIALVKPPFFPHKNQK